MNLLELSDAEAAAVQKTPNRVTLAGMEAKIVAERFINLDIAPHLTICALLLSNGFTLVGKAAPADPANFNAELGMKFAREDAVRQMWPLEGYALCDRLAAEG
jgi:hypothetical protein